MKERIKNILKHLNVYHLLQGNYRELVEFANKQYYKAIYLKYQEKGYICNFCRSKYAKFVDAYPSPNIANALYSNNVIAGPGKNVYCPSCLSKNRERLVKAVLEDLFDIRGKCILHFSPEKHLYKYLKEITDVKTVDISPAFYRNIDNNISYADATNLQFPDNSFDIVIANHILEHIPDDRLAMREIFRSLKTGGFAILQVPYSETLPSTIEDPYINNPEKQEQLYGQKDHVRIYSLQDYLSRLKIVGFNVKLLTADELSQYRIYATQEKEAFILGYK